MALELTRARTIVIAVHAMIVITMLILMLGTGALFGRNPLLAWLILLVPLLVIGASAVNIRRRERILAWWGLALLMVPIAGLGIFGGWGLLYLIGIIFLIWGAWQENEGRS